jgi:hypothetical protein
MFYVRKDRLLEISDLLDEIWSKNTVAEKYDEYTTQVEVVNWFEKTYPDVLIYHAGNEGKRSKITGHRLKMMGVRAGVPDLTICWAEGGYHGLYIELKSEKGKVSVDQKKTIDKLRKADYLVAISRTYEETVTLIYLYMEGKVVRDNDKN